MTLLLKIIIALLILGIILGLFQTWRVQHHAFQKTFEKGTIPKPDGLYKGTVQEIKVSWLGKKFNANDSTGINLFKREDGKEEEKYPFKTSVGKGAHDKKLDVIKIDYNIKENPFWLRPILDEIVEIAPGEYLGKLHIRILPGFSFSLAYFELKK